MPYERTTRIRLADGVVILFNRSGRPIERYSVVLIVRDDGEWKEARMFDNHLGNHHMHRYTRREGKQPPAPFHPGPTRAAIPAAIAHLKAHYKEIIRSWRA